MQKITEDQVIFQTGLFGDIVLEPYFGNRFLVPYTEKGTTRMIPVELGAYFDKAEDALQHDSTERTLDAIPQILQDIKQYIRKYHRRNKKLRNCLQPYIAINWRTKPEEVDAVLDQFVLKGLKIGLDYFADTYLSIYLGRESGHDPLLLAQFQVGCSVYHFFNENWDIIEDTNPVL